MKIFPKLGGYLPTAKGLIKNYVNGTAINPFYASFKLTYRCHFSCSFCNMEDFKVKDMSTEDVIKILDNLSRSSVIMTSFEGGDPLLRKDIGEILEYVDRCNFYLLFTTSERDLLNRYPMEKYAKHIDYLHISIDEGHENLEMFDLLPALTKLDTQVSVQTVVTSETLETLEQKVARCYRTGANIVIIPATRMDGTEDHFPNIEDLEHKMLYLRNKYPATIHTPQGYFEAYRKAQCSSSSVVIGPDGRLFYPCHVLGIKGPDLREVDLTEWLKQSEAVKGREKMRSCERNCGFYQYYSTNSYTSLDSVYSSLRPIFKSRQPRI